MRSTSTHLRWTLEVYWCDVTDPVEYILSDEVSIDISQAVSDRVTSMSVHVQAVPLWLALWSASQGLHRAVPVNRGEVPCLHVGSRIYLRRRRRLMMTPELMGALCCCA